MAEMSINDYRLEPDMYFLKEEKYTGTHPNFYDPSYFPWVEELESKYSIILNEIDSVISGKEEMPPIINPPYLSSPNAWSNFYFLNFRWFNHTNCLKYPRTFAIFSDIPNLSFAGITVLEPHSKVLPHIGETNATIRCHLGLKIPGNYLECGLRVNGEDRGYHEGKVVMFSDAHFHTTWNNTDERRFIIVFDVVQDHFAHKSNWVCANSLSALTIKYMNEKIGIIKPLPDFLLHVLLKIIALAWFIYLPIQKSFRWPTLLKVKAKKLFSTKPKLQ